ncbi:DUF2238 domain-containing protein [Sphingomonas naphthae]|uniref:DUF2238 domain-containing protein n=1 Tax=Sphingomonas naphthae TaxID=1813468 RepID=A0ABY7TS06_9SPHN|nr:DUF2238 domain-containing protein [Sphingomonas naphthae]WCT74634.1 DUF2238 domain-containing protein [Sphingomonas naphthae]
MERFPVWRALPPAQRALLVILGVAVVAAQVRQPFPDMAPIQHAPTVLLLVAAPWLLRRWPLSTRSVACVIGFFLLHTLAGRYIYSYVPYDVWAKALTGHTISTLTGWRRNCFDRLVHFSFGLLAVRPIAELLQRYVGAGRRLSLYVAVEFVLAFSCVYEIFEWALTLMMAGADAEAYNGQQGDPWDAQKDMAMAMAGAIVAAAIIALGRRRVGRKAAAQYPV